MKTKTGWKCPVCGMVWSPKTSGCEHCNVNISDATNAIKKLWGQCDPPEVTGYASAKEAQEDGKQIFKRNYNEFPGIEDLVVNNDVATYEIANFPHEEKLSSYQLRKTYEALRKAHGEVMRLNGGHESMESEQ